MFLSKIRAGPHIYGALFILLLLLDKMSSSSSSGGDWAGGLCGYASGDEDDCLLCLCAVACPSVIYGVNYHVAMMMSRSPTNPGHHHHPDNKLDCILPCIAHSLADTCISTIALSVCFNCTGGSIVLPLACCLRYTHRRAAIAMAPRVHNDDDDAIESKCATFATEFLCYGCSLAQVNRQFNLQRNAAASGAGQAAATMTGSGLIGTLRVANHMPRAAAAAPMII